jgi:FIMAH domain
MTNGFITAVLRSECTDAPIPPPPVGETVVGPDYVIMTVANGDPLDYQKAQQMVTDGVFESLMPLYCALPDNRCVTNRVQWNLLTYDAGGNPRISGSPASGPGFHYCAITNGYVVAIVSGESAALPPLPPVGQVAVGSDSVILTIADGDPMNLEVALGLGTDILFESLMRHYCALPRGTGVGYVSGRAQWHVATYDAGGNLKLSACATNGCDFHQCVVSKGFITAVLRSECTDAPTPPPPVGGITVGPDYVVMTVADGDPLDYAAAQQFARDAVFESLMPFYCTLAQNRTRGCVTNRVQWNLLTYDAGGNPKISGSPTSGSGFHYFGPCSLTPRERINQLKVWVNVDVAAGILDRRDGRRLTIRLNAALRQLPHGHGQSAINQIERFLAEVDALVKSDELSSAAGQPLIEGALAIIAERER